MEDARLLGQTSYIFEVGSGMVIDGEETFLTGELQPAMARPSRAQVEESGAGLLLERAEAGSSRHPGTSTARSHLFRGLVDVDAANAALAGEGDGLRLVDNGAIPPHETSLDLPGRRTPTT